MEDNFYKDEFEQFLKKQADSHRIYPSDKVWRIIHKEIHGEKNWPALTIAAFVLFTTIIAISVHFSYKPDIFAGLKTSLQAVPATSNSANTSSISSTLVLAGNSAAVNPEYWKKQTSRIDHTNSNSLTRVQPTLDEVTAKPTTTDAVDPEVESILSAKLVDSTSKEIALEPAAIENMESAVAADKVAVPDIAMQNSTNQLAPNLMTPELPAKARKDKDSWKNKFSYQVYLTPSMSYRKLRESLTDKESGEGPMALNLVANVHQIVRHKPGNGLEAGMAVFYSVTPKLHFKSGLQVNMRQYSIAAYKATTEIATITLYGNSRVDTISSFANYRTNTGIEDAQLTNRYYQLALPIGFEVELLGTKNLQLNVGASVQPTYQLNTRVYTLATNMKNYTQTDGMLQRWNINSSLEANLSFKAGTYKWHLGPQVRYQHLPSMIPQYQFKEYLVDYGIKLAVTKPL